MKITINAGGREVTIETADANLTPKDLASQALAVWRETESAKTSEGPAFGYVPAIAGTPSGYVNFRQRSLEITSEVTP